MQSQLSDTISAHLLCTPRQLTYVDFNSPILLEDTSCFSGRHSRGYMAERPPPERTRRGSPAGASIQPTPIPHRSLYSKASRREFQHARLDLRTGSLRLLEVLPLDHSGLVRCKIRHATTDARYTCVSYVWGPPNETLYIYIDGKRFHVRRNIYEFLQTVNSQIALKLEDHGGAGLLNFHDTAQSLWIDALCIDQGRNDEKNHQVQQMGTIFSTAERVIAWMGKKPQYAALYRYVQHDMHMQPFIDVSYYMALHDEG